MLEGQTFAAAGRLGQFMRIAHDVEREDVEAVVDRLMAQLEVLDALDAERLGQRA